MELIFQCATLGHGPASIEVAVHFPVLWVEKRLWDGTWRRTFSTESDERCVTFTFNDSRLVVTSLESHGYTDEQPSKSLHPSLEVSAVSKIQKQTRGRGRAEDAPAFLSSHPFSTRCLKASVQPYQSTLPLIF